MDPNPNPVSPKVSAATAAGALVAIVVWIAKTAFALDIPPEVAAALVVVIMAGSAYIRRDPMRDAGRAAAFAVPETPVGELRAVREAKGEL